MIMPFPGKFYRLRIMFYVPFLPSISAIYNISLLFSEYQDNFVEVHTSRNY